MNFAIPSVILLSQKLLASLLGMYLVKDKMHDYLLFFFIILISITLIMLFWVEQFSSN